MIDQDLLSEVQYAMLEPVIDGGQTWGSEVWSRAEVTDGLNSALWALLRDTHAILTFTSISQLATSNGVVSLPLDWMATGSMVWRDGATGRRTPLSPVDRFQADLALTTWEDTAGSPLAYNEQEGDTLQLLLVPKNLTDGVLELLYVARPPALLGEGLAISVPEEFLSPIKYKLIGFLLQTVGRLTDADRSSYCQRRYDLGVAVAQILLGGWA